VSAMHNKLSSEIYSGRPFGGVAFLWRRSLSNYINVIDSDDCGRCLAIMLNCYIMIKLVNVYFPCYCNNIQYTVDLGNCIGFIENLLLPLDNAIIVGDVNFACTESSPGYLQCKPVFDLLNMAHCDTLVSAANPVTYVSSHLNCSSFIDDCFISLNACWNSVYRKLFGFNRWESVKSFICGLGRLDLHHIIRIHRTKFYLHVICSCNLLLYNMFWVHMSLNYSKLCDIDAIVFKFKSNICNDIYEHFQTICV
jgi:hypothetical protein